LLHNAWYSIRDIDKCQVLCGHKWAEALDLLAGLARYSLRELVGTLLACGGGVNLKNTTPQDIAGTAVPHTAYAVMRQPAAASMHGIG
jgi:hypothetical protein